LASWREIYADPLASEEGQALLESILAERQRSKAVRKLGRSNGASNGTASGLKNGTPHWTETDWMPTPETYPCACGCGEAVTWQGIGRRPQYVNDAHRKRHGRHLRAAVPSGN